MGGRRVVAGSTSAVCAQCWQRQASFARHLWNPATAERPEDVDWYSWNRGASAPQSLPVPEDADALAAIRFVVRTGLAARRDRLRVTVKDHADV